MLLDRKISVCKMLVLKSLLLPFLAAFLFWGVGEGRVSVIASDITMYLLPFTSHLHNGFCCLGSLQLLSHTFLHIHYGFYLKRHGQTGTYFKLER